MNKVGKALAVSFGALAGGAGGFYLLEAYKIKTKVNQLSFIPSSTYFEWFTEF